MSKPVAINRRTDAARTETCDTCRFWDHPGYDGYVGPYQCRRHAPIGIYKPGTFDSAALWPHTGQTAWCGDWEREPDPRLCVENEEG